MSSVVIDWRKWPLEPYRSTPMSRLGADENGAWFFAPRGTAFSRVEMSAVVLPVHFLTLVPNAPGWIATWMWGNPEHHIDVYVDIVTGRVWETETRLRVVDLDLDVIRERNGTVFIDDEDEFAENTVARNYPADVVASARATAEELLDAVIDRKSPFGEESATWRAVATARLGG